MMKLFSPQGHFGSPAEAGDSCQFVFICGQCKCACSWAICLWVSNVFVSRCIKSTVALRFSHATHCRLVLLSVTQYRYGQKCGLISLRFHVPEPLGYCAARQYGQGRNLNGSFFLTGYTCHIAWSNVISSPRWFLSAAFRVLSGDLYRNGWCRCQGRGRNGLPTPSLSSPCLSFLSLSCADSLWDERWLSAACGR